MKNKPSQYLKLCLIVFGMALFMFNCQEEDDLEKQKQTQVINQKSTIKTVSAKDVPDVLNFIQSKSNSRMQFRLDDSNSPEGQFRSHEDNLSLTTTLTDQIKQVTNGYGKSNYTFSLIEEETKEGTYFLNLIVKEYKDTYYLYIVKYVADDTWSNTNSIHKNFSDFTGTIYFYSDEGIYLAKVEMANGSSTSTERHPCNDGDSGDGNDGGDGGSGNSGDGDATGDSGTDSGSNTDSGDTTGNDSTDSSNSDSSGTGSGGDLTCGWYMESVEGPCPPDCDCDTNVCQWDMLTWSCSGPNYGANSTEQSFNDYLRHPCDDVPEVCYEASGDPCPYGCNEAGDGCAEEPDENDDVGVISGLDCIAENNELSGNSPFNVDLSNVNPCSVDQITTPEDEKFMCIYRKLVESDGFKNLFIDTFGEENNNLDVKFVVTDSLTYDGSSVNGLARRTDYEIDSDGNLTSINITIEINGDMLDPTNTQAEIPLSIASTIIHESIHAYLYVKILDCNSGVDLTNINDILFEDLLNIFFENQCSQPQSQHDFMFDFMLPTMQQILSEIRDDILPENQQQAVENTDFYDLSQLYGGPLTESTPFTWEDCFYYISINGLQEADFYQNAIAEDPIQVFLRNMYRHEMNQLSKNCNE